MEKKIKRFSGSRIKGQLLVFLALFIVAEIVLRIFGFRAGTAIDDFIPQDHPVYQPRFISDERGMNYISTREKELLMPGSSINQQGFRGNVAYTPQAIDSLRKSNGKEIIMVIGDSFVEGCCPDSVTHSFPDLVNRTGKYTILNFGIAGTDPLQYRLVAEKYVPLLKPDRVVVVSYFGNDVLIYERVPTPGIPESYPFKNNKWISPIAENYISEKMNYKFKDAGEAFRFYMDHYTLRGESRNVFEKSISYSVIFSKLYLAVERRLRQRYWMKRYPYTKTVDGYEQAYAQFHTIDKLCDSLQIPCIFTGIPEPTEAADLPMVRKKYQPMFKDIPWSVPAGFSVADYTGSAMANHYNTEGHKKYALFLEHILDATRRARK
ncbi:hypothetical protein CNR22_04070 [Sphingobacteriaceae bacterium]|nr:hypothetical protein CNR22_04070 [Sphingobacteriaceae bacterium]